MVIVVNLDQFPNTSCCSLARKMLAKGHDPEKLIEFRRGKTKVFKQNNSIRWWASRDARESENGQWMRFVPYKAIDQ